MPESSETQNSFSEPVDRQVRGRYRREFMQGLATAAAATASAALLRGQNTPASPTPSAANDIQLLNYALTLEYLEATFYTQGLARFSPADFRSSNFYGALQSASGITEAPMSGETGTGLVQDIYAYLSLIRNHEQAHVRLLTSTIRSLGGTPISAPRFQFPYTTVDEFIVLAATLENTGVAAYNGALPMVSNPALITAGATIATVEARHAAYLNRLRGMNPFPDAFDAGKTMAEILQIAGPFLAQ